MKLAVITPPTVSKAVSTFRLSYQMVLATYCNDPFYIGYHRNLAAMGAFTILDNGAAEYGESLPFDEVVSFGEAIGVDEIVMPDALQDGPRTVKLTEMYLDLVPQRNRFVVPQGKSWAEWDHCLRYLVTMGCRTIGIPKMYEEFPDGRARALKFIIDYNYHLTHDIHLLGCYKDPQTEIHSALKAYPWIRGIDTGAPIAHAQANKPMDYNEHISLQWGKYARYKQIKSNIMTMLTWCNGGFECILP